MPIDVPTYATLSAMITPALFMGGNGSLIISTSNRMSRVVDRFRVLNDLGDSLCRGATGLDYCEERLAHISDQLRHLEWRSDRIRYALTMLYLAFGSFVGTSLTLAIDALAGNRLPAIPTCLSIVGVILMMGASINLVREAQRALMSNRQEVRFFRELRDKRAADAACLPARLRRGRNPCKSAPSQLDGRPDHDLSSSLTGNTPLASPLATHQRRDLPDGRPCPPPTRGVRPPARSLRGARPAQRRRPRA